MKPIGPLMREHRLIERMVNVLDQRILQTKEKNRVDANLIAVAIDFFRTYADRTHHGKEEDILFRALAEKQLSPRDSKTMNELIQEHIWARKMVTSLLEARSSYLRGREEALQDIVNHITELVEFYPMHIAKEDKNFFYPCLDYLSEQEQQDMLQEFWEFDRQLIHEKYQKVVEETERKIA